MDWSSCCSGPQGAWASPRREAPVFRQQSSEHRWRAVYIRCEKGQESAWHPHTWLHLDIRFKGASGPIYQPVPLSYLLWRWFFKSPSLCHNHTNMYHFFIVHLCIYFVPLNLKLSGWYYYFHVTCQKGEGIATHSWQGYGEVQPDPAQQGTTVTPGPRGGSGTA